MHFLFLGTGAADYPEDYLTNPEYKNEGKSMRRCTSTLLDGTLLLDAGVHIRAALDEFGVDPAHIENILYTHRHTDHFHPGVLKSIAAARDALGMPLSVYAPFPAPADIPENVQWTTVQTFSPFPVGIFTVRAMEASHTVDTVWYHIDDGEKTLLYALDGAWFPCRTAYALRNAQLDYMILDATVGDIPGDYRVFEHNSLPMLRLMAKSFCAFGFLAPDGKIILDHIARTLHAPHEKLCEDVAADGFLVAYDGMTL